MTPKGPDLILDRETHTIRITRDFDAPRAQVFDAWTQPEQVAEWWDPEGNPLAVCEIDLKVGGSFQFVTQGSPENAFAGTYREIARPDHLAFEAMGAMGQLRLREESGRTQLTVEILCRSREQFDQFIQWGIHEGTAQTLDNLVAYARQRL